MSPQREPVLDVVVLNWRDEEMTKTAVSSLPVDEGVRHVYVVDNESSGDLSSESFATGLEVTVLEVKENRGFAGGIDVAFSYRRRVGATGPVLVLNNDVELTKGAVEALLAAHSAHPRALIGPRLLNPDGSVQAEGHRISRLTGIARPVGARGAIDYITWACVLVPDWLYHELGGLDQAFFMYWEDTDFGLRASAAGYENRLAPEAVAVHALSASGRKVGEKLTEYYVRSLRAFGRKHGGIMRMRSYVAFVLILAKRLAVGDFVGARAVMKGWRTAWSSPAYKSVERSV